MKLLIIRFQLKPMDFIQIMICDNYLLHFITNNKFHCLFNMLFFDNSFYLISVSFTITEPVEHEDRLYSSIFHSVTR